MKNWNCSYRFVRLLSLFLVIGLTVSCKKKEPSSDEYIQAIEKMAEQQNAKILNDGKNGTGLESVIFTSQNSTLTYRYHLSDEAIATVNVNDSNTRKDIIGTLSNDLKECLVKGNCRLKYMYVSPHDSSFIEIVPDELVNTPQ